LQILDTQFDFICLTESKIHADKLLKVDINIPGYQPPVSIPTEASKGGVLMYVKNGIDFLQRSDLNIYKSVFIELLNPKEKNTIIGTIYRHPCMEENQFIDEYMKPLCDKLNAENKPIYLAGDFNLDFN